MDRRDHVFFRSRSLHTLDERGKVMRSSALFSQDEVYRYELRREWDERLPPFCAIMLNPSTANAHKNDPTITRMIKRASRMGFGSLIVLNVGAGRNTDPKKWAAMADPIGPRNWIIMKRVLKEVYKRKGTVLVGWGVHAPRHYEKRIARLARETRLDLYCLGETKDKRPRHPLHVAYTKELELWSGWS